MIALLVTTLAISDSAMAFTIGNTSGVNRVGSGIGFTTLGQSFNINGTGASILLNDWTFAVFETDGLGDPIPFTSLATLNIYEGNGIGGTFRGSATAFDSSVTLAGRNAAKWTFTGGGLSLLDNQTYTAAVFSSGDLSFDVSSSNVYDNGYLTASDPDFASLLGTSYDTVFEANYSSATPVPFEFEPTGGLLVLGGGWLLCRHLKKRATKVK